MEQIFLAYGLPKATGTDTIILYKHKRKVCSPDGDTDCFDIIVGVLKRGTLAPYQSIIGLDYIL